MNPRQLLQAHKDNLLRATAPPSPNATKHGWVKGIIGRVELERKAMAESLKACEVLYRRIDRGNEPNDQDAPIKHIVAALRRAAEIERIRRGERDFAVCQDGTTLLSAWPETNIAEAIRAVFADANPSDRKFFRMCSPVQLMLVEANIAASKETPLSASR